MLDYHLTKQERAELRQAHRQTHTLRAGYRLNAMIQLVRGRTVADSRHRRIFADRSRYGAGILKRIKSGALDVLLRMDCVASEALLNLMQLAELGAHLRTTIYSTADAVARWLATAFGFISRSAV